MAVQNKVKKTSIVADKNILIPMMPFASVGGVVGNTGVTAKGGKKIILAGTPVGGTTSFLEDEQAVLTIANDLTDGGKAQGVVLHDVDVTDGDQNATVVIFGFINLNRVDSTLTIAEEAKTALENKVTFLKRN